MNQDATQTNVGYLVITGGQKDVDFTYDDLKKDLYILTSTEIMISNKNYKVKEDVSIYVNENVEGHLIIKGLHLDNHISIRSKLAYIHFEGENIILGGVKIGERSHRAGRVFVTGDESTLSKINGIFGSFEELNIESGRFELYAQAYCAAIGGELQSSFGTVNINGGIIECWGPSWGWANGIGSGQESNGGKVNINGGKINADGSWGGFGFAGYFRTTPDCQSIINGSIRDTKDRSHWNGIINEVVYGDVTVTKDVTLYSLRVLAGSILRIADGVQITFLNSFFNDGEVIGNDRGLVEASKSCIVNKGEMYVNGIFESWSYNGTIHYDPILEVKISRDNKVIKETPFGSQIDIYVREPRGVNHELIMMEKDIIAYLFVNDKQIGEAVVNKEADKSLTATFTNINVDEEYFHPDGNWIRVQVGDSPIFSGNATSVPIEIRNPSN